jgi:hypothetical protein
MFGQKVTDVATHLALAKGDPVGRRAWQVGYDLWLTRSCPR